MLWFSNTAGLGLWRTCQVCGNTFELHPHETINRCLSCRQSSRNKACRKCGAMYADTSAKNTRRYCDGCQPLNVKIEQGISKRLQESRRGRVRNGGGGRSDDLRTMKVGTDTWWGRVGEILCLYLYPIASDMVADRGNRSPFDVQHPTYGRINVKTVGQTKTPYGLPTWKFQLDGVGSCDYMYLIGLNVDRTRVVRAWFPPANVLPRSVKNMTPDSKEYVAAYEVSDVDIGFLNRKLEAILSGVHTEPEHKPVIQDYERIVLGRVGESIYQSLYPLANHVSLANPTETYDFLDGDGVRVNVRVRRLTPRDSGPDRWTFTRSKGSTADMYHLIGLDQMATQVLSMFRVPANDMPPAGMSISKAGSPKWDRYLIGGLDLPTAISVFTPIAADTSFQIEIGGLTQRYVSSMPQEDKESLVQRAMQFYRKMGFPYPQLPTDDQIRNDLTSLSNCHYDNNMIPVNQIGLGVCSAYMPHRFEARNSDADFSAVGAFHNDVRLLRAIRFCLLGERPNLGAGSLRSALAALNRTPGGFRPSVARILADAFCPPKGVVFDPCAGWGGRMFGVLSSGRVYMGVEPAEKTYTALYRLGMHICSVAGLGRNYVQLVHAPIQSAVVAAESADFAITSPPFWTKEIYDGGERDSICVDEWRESFLVKMFKQVHRVLRPDANFVVHISDVIDQGVHVPLTQIVQSTGMGCGFMLHDVWHMQKASFGRQKNNRVDPLLIFRKIST